VVRRTAARIDISDMGELIIEAKGTKPWFRYIIEVRNAAIARRLEQGMTVREVADDIGLPKSVVGRISQELSIG
jgi:DNA invertase Pin-like site-specific DNA recombinase